MSLLNLKSIFEDEIRSKSEDYISRRPEHSNDSRFQFNVPVPGLDFDSKFSQSPILDTLLRNPIPNYSELQFVSSTNNGFVDAIYLGERFDSRVPKNDGINFLLFHLWL